MRQEISTISHLISSSYRYYPSVHIVSLWSATLDAVGVAPTASKVFTLDGAVGGIRTLGRLMTATRFPVVLVMTSSIPLHKRKKINELYYSQFLPHCQDKFWLEYIRKYQELHIENINSFCVLFIKAVQVPLLQAPSIPARHIFHRGCRAGIRLPTAGSAMCRPLLSR